MKINKKMFRNELTLIQQRHSLFFPASQKGFVKIKMVNDEPKLVFTTNCNLDTVIRLEIRMAFKLSQRNYHLGKSITNDDIL